MLNRTRLNSDAIIAEFRKPELLEVDAGQIENLGAATLGVAEDLRVTRWVIAFRVIGDPLSGIRQ